jgi:hypothetical protein
MGWQAVAPARFLRAPYPERRVRSAVSGGCAIASSAARIARATRGALAPVGARSASRLATPGPALNAVPTSHLRSSPPHAAIEPAELGAAPPALAAQVLTHTLPVADQMLGGVHAHIRPGMTRDEVPVAHVEHRVVVRLDGRVQAGRAANLGELSAPRTRPPHLRARMTRNRRTSGLRRRSLLAALLLVSAVPAVAEARPQASGRTALTAVDQLMVKGRGPMTGYDRSRFGDAWFDADHNGCDTRDDILRRDLRQRTLRAGTHGCIVTSGTLADPYTATRIRYVRGHSRIDIDHVVALGDAWQLGAARWAAGERVAFANDPLNLLAVSASANRQKGDSDAASWLPRSKAFRCTYIARQVAVKLKYRLAATPSERVAMRRVLDSCPALSLPGAGASSVSFAVHAPTAPAHRPGVRRYANCSAARAAGVTPIRRGTKLYAANRHLDGDGDGVACE